MNELALFAGAGGGILGGHLLGWKTVCAVEWADYPRRVLLARQRDGLLPRFPIWDEVQTFDGKLWKGRVDVVSGGFPCQDISAAGKGAGIDGERSGMWKHMARIIGEVRPRFAFVENSPLLVGRGLAVVLGDLAAMGYDARWCVLGACDAGAPHRRDRIWILADSNSQHGGASWTSEVEAVAAITACATSEQPASLANTNSAQRQGNECAKRVEPEHPNTCGASWWESEPAVGRVAHGVAYRVDRLKAIGNGQVPAVVKLAWKTIGGPVE